MEKVNDIQLIEAIKQGEDSKVFSQLYEYTFPKIKSFILKGGGQEEDAQDIFQDAVMAFFRIVLKGTYQHKTEVDAYIYVVARNAWYSKNKKNVKTTTLDTVVAYENEEYGPESKMMDGEKQQALKKLLSSLGERCENLLINTIYYNMSLKEVVEKMGYTNINAVKTKKYKCKQRLIKAVQNNRGLINLLKY